MNTFPNRLISFFIVFFLVLLLPWWVSSIILAALTIYFPLYLEVLFFGLLFDTLYSVKLTFPYTALSIAFIFLLIVTSVRPLFRTSYA